MKKKILFLFIIIVQTGFLYGNANNAKQAYEKANAHHKKVDYQSAVPLALEAYNIALAEKDEFYQIKSLFLLGWLQRKLNNIISSSNHYFDIILHQENLKSDEAKKVLHSTYRNLSIIALKFEEIEFAKNLINESQILATNDLKDTVLILKSIDMKMSSLLYQKSYLEAVRLADNTLNKFAKSNHVQLTEIKIMKGVALYHLGAHELTLQIMDDCVEDGRLSDRELDRLYSIVGLIHIDHGNLDKALIDLNKALDICIKKNNPTFIIGTYKNLAYFYEKSKQFNQAISSLEKAIEIYEKNNVKDDYYIIYRDISDYYSIIGEEVKALAYYNKYLEELEVYYRTKEQLHNSNEAVQLALMKKKMDQMIASRDTSEEPIFSMMNPHYLIFILIAFIGGVYYLNSIRKRQSIINDLKKIGIESNI